MHIMDVTISPTRLGLSSTGSTLSRDPGALNLRDAVCPYITDWLTMGTRKGHWVCADAENCKYQHECKGGRECDAEVCHLRHPAEESRWIVCANKKERWVLSMSMDEALHYPGPGKIAELVANEENYTCADVWRASVKAVAYGRKEVVTAGGGGPSGQTKAPKADATAHASHQHLYADHRKAAAQPALPSAQQLVVMPQGEGPSDPTAAKREREAADAAALADSQVPPPPKRAKNNDSPTEPPATQHTGSNKGKGSAGKGGSKGKSAGKGSGKGSGHVATQVEEDDEECLHFIRLTEAYITNDMSGAYRNSLTRAARLTPAERASLLVNLASMIQEDQSKTLRLLKHSLRVCQHFAD